MKHHTSYCEGIVLSLDIFGHYSKGNYFGLQLVQHRLLSTAWPGRSPLPGGRGVAWKRLYPFKFNNFTLDPFHIFEQKENNYKIHIICAPNVRRHRRSHRDVRANWVETKFVGHVFNAHLVIMMINDLDNHFKV